VEALCRLSSTGKIALRRLSGTLIRSLVEPGMSIRHALLVSNTVEACILIRTDNLAVSHKTMLL